MCIIISEGDKLIVQTHCGNVCVDVKPFNQPEVRVTWPENVAVKCKANDMVNKGTSGVLLFADENARQQAEESR